MRGMGGLGKVEKEDEDERRRRGMEAEEDEGRRKDERSDTHCPCLAYKYPCNGMLVPRNLPRSQFYI